MTEDNNPSKRKLEEALRDAGIEPSIRDIGNGTMEFSIPLYDDTFLSGIAYGGFPIEGNIPDRDKRKIVFDLSNFVTRISNLIIYYTLDNLQESLRNEQNGVAFAFLQRASIFHICNHKLSIEGITTERRGKQCTLVDEYKTMPLTRSVYEHLAMFYYLFFYSDSQDQLDIIWKSWLLGSKRNQVKGNDPEFKKERIKANDEIEEIKRDLMRNNLVRKCKENLKGQLDYCLNSNSVFTISKKGDYIAEKLSYDKAWKYLYGDRVNFSLSYNFLSLHSHPTYKGLSDFYNQDENIEFPLYESCHYLAYLCRLFMKRLHINQDEIIGSFTKREQGIFSLLSNADSLKTK